MADQLISIICPYYNRQDFLGDCIKSLIAQTYKNLEILLIDDGSTDKSSEIANGFDDQRIKHIKTDHNGCWSAKNTGIQHANGEFICFVDSDDFISPDYIEAAIKIIDANPDEDYYYPHFLTIADETGQITNSIWKYVDQSSNSGKNLIYLFYNNLVGGIPHAGALIRRKTFANKLYDDNLVNLADTVFIIKNALSIRFYPIKSQAKYYNRQHQNQTNKNQEARCKAFAELIFYIWENYPAEYYLSEEYDKIKVAEAVVQRLMDLHQKNAQACDHYMQYAKKVLTWIRENE